MEYKYNKANNRGRYTDVGLITILKYDIFLFMITWQWIF